MQKNTEQYRTIQIKKIQKANKQNAENTENTSHRATDILFYFFGGGRTTVFSHAQKVLTFYWELCVKVS